MFDFSPHLSTKSLDIRDLMQKIDLLSALMDGSPIATFVIDTDHRVIHWNRACEILTGVPREKMVGKPVDSKAFYPDQPQRPVLANVVLNMDKDMMMQYYGEAGLEESTIQAETFEVKSELVMKNGVNTYAHFIATRLRNSDGKVIGAIETLQDITDEKVAELEIIKARKAGEAANRAKNEFLANMSHELRTPMNGILGVTDFLLNTGLNTEQREYTEMLKESADNLLNLINNILDFSNIEADRTELAKIEFELEPLLSDTLMCLEALTIGRNLRLSFSASDSIPAKLIGDPWQLKKILVHLVGNAIKFTKQGEVCVRVVPEQSSSIAGGNSDGRNLHFSVTDTGIGIPAEKIDSIFQAFTQADGSSTRNHEGTGLGLLAICDRIVKLKGGNIWVESEVGSGSTFHFTARF